MRSTDANPATRTDSAELRSATRPPGAAFLLATSLVMLMPFFGTACTSSEEPGDRQAPVMELQPMDPSNPDSSAHSLERTTDAARQHLAEELGVPADDIELVERRAVTWRNGALGCPEPGMAYTQALVPGYWIRLQVGSERFDYHAARGQAPFHCPSERSERPLPPDDAPEA